MMQNLASGPDLQEYLRSLKGSDLHFQPNPGNAGDALVAHATFQALRRLGLDYRVFDRRRYSPGRSVLVYGGGGNLTYYDQARKFIQRHHRSAGKFILLPQTIRGNEQLLGEFGANVDILCREEISFAHARMHAPRACVLLMKDAAFELDVNETMNTDVGRLLPRLLSGRLLRGSPRNTGRLLLSLPAGRDARRDTSAGSRGILNSLRTDREKSGIEIPRGNIDVSKKFAYGTHDEAVCQYTTLRLLGFLNQYEEVRTNRLHVAIAGALLGKNVKFYSNSYYKCKAVYDFSMRGSYPNVEWMG